MLYLNHFQLCSEQEEYRILCQKRNIHNHNYPLRIYPSLSLSSLSFDPVAIFAGPNGCGKNTLLRIIYQKLSGPSDDAADLFQYCVNVCNAEMCCQKRDEISFPASGDVSDELLNERAINVGVHRRKEELAQKYLNAKYSYAALSFFEQKIHDHSLYLLDEPENSLSAYSQLKLKEFIEESARFYDCQFMIATHSAFITAIDHARIYDLDSSPVRVRKWSDLESGKTYYQFFQSHKNEF